MIDLKSIPTNPGCYLYKDNSNNIIYIGKAKNLKKRVSSYFNKKDLDTKTKQLVKNIKDVEFVITDSEVEALILENTLIKRHKPKYNIDLKDSKRYAYLMIPEEPFPRLLLARNKTMKGKYFGPFVSGDAREELKKLLNKTFLLRTCKRFPKRACLKYHIGICSAPCIKNISEEKYNENLKSVEQILSGKTSKLKTELKTKMKTASKDLKYEEAITYRNQLNAITYLEDKQNMDLNKSYDEDILNYKVSNNKVYLILFNIYKGTLENKQEFILEETTNFLEEFITQYYDENKPPKEIILPNKLDESINEFLNLKRGSKVTLNNPKVGPKKQLLELVSKNIEAIFFHKLNKLIDLKEQLNLNDLPHVIECFDISHLGGTLGVASMVQFKDSIPNKSEYRRFRIKSFVGNDDFRSMSEVIQRRYSRLKRENKPFPDLIVVDGGKGQLSSAIKELNKLEIKIPIISLAKKLEEVFEPGRQEPILLKRKSKALLLLQAIRDEAHRFAIKYNRQLRTKEMYKG